LSTGGSVRRHFQKKAVSFDDLYEDERRLQRLLRPGLFARRELARAVVASYDRPRVLDVGCGSGRFGEFALQAGASEYTGIDFAEAMLDLAGRRLAGRDNVHLVLGDFLTTQLDGTFDVVVALGFFDYTAEPERLVLRMRELCSGSVVASFPRWNWIKGPVRKLRYELIDRCPIFTYTGEELELLFGAAGFERVEVIPRGRTGYLLRADTEPDRHEAPISR
jgi:SAM-dependent methyltransferase